MYIPEVKVINEYVCNCFQLKDAETDSQFVEICQDLASWAEMCGCSNLDEATSLQERDGFVASLKRHFLIHR
jgi:hypothetical protein